MSSLFSKIALGTYRGIGYAAYPFMGPFLRFRASRGKEDRSRRYERYGYPSADKPAGPMVWFHAASVGESMAVMPLVEHVNELGINTIMTTGTVTSAQVMRKRLPKQSFHQYVPLDLKPALERFLDHWQPDLAIFTESEIWPMTMLELAQRKTPSVLVNARMSDRSFRRWTNASGLAESLFEHFSHVVAQSETDGKRFRKLGAHPVSISGNLKADNHTLPFDETEKAHLEKRIDSRPTWIAVSTHEGEEEIVARIHRSLRERIPDLLTLIAPRHPERADGIEAMLGAHNLKVARRSRRETIETGTDIYLCDTIGEMGLFLSLVQVAFMGKSLASSGGQNPLEPAATGTAIVSGRHVQNFRDTYKKLLEAGGVRLVSDEKMLAANIEFLLNNPAERERMGLSALKSIVELGGGLEKTVNVLDAYLFPLTVRRDLGSMG